MLARLPGGLLAVGFLALVWLISLKFGSTFYLRSFDRDAWGQYEQASDNYPHRCQMAGDAKRKFAVPGTQKVAVVNALGAPNNHPEDDDRTLHYELGTCFFEQGLLTIHLDTNNNVISVELQ